ncbi:MAG TPA: septum formation initiator family protein, partial [Pilimelia sp.]|nr:septum formation initiator family protein [Pilimelia sp.]
PTRGAGPRTGGRDAAGRAAGGRGAGWDGGARAEPRALGRPATARRAPEGPRPGNRPAAARRAAAGGAAKRTTAPQPRRLTGRATVLLVVLALLALGYTYPVRVYLTQESEIASLEAAQREQRRRIQELTEEVAKWQDDEYVRIQARKRFYYARPGEVLLVVWDSDNAPEDAGAGPKTAPPPPDPWYETLWSSIEAADQETRR